MAIHFTDFLATKEYWIFLSELFLTNIFFSLCAAGILKRFDKGNSISPAELTVYSLGLGPAIAALFLYYLFLLIPGKAPALYTSGVLSVFLAAGIFSRKEISLLLSGSFATLKQIVSKKYFLPLLVFAMGSLFAFLILWSYYIFTKQITEHDTLEYAIQGKIFARDRVIGYAPVRYDEQSGFYYVGLHGFSFPLLATWERLLNETTGIAQDLYFRSVNSYYGIITLLLMFITLFRQNKALAFWGTGALLITYGFFENIMKYHLDNFRIWFLCVAVLFMIRLIREPSTFNLICFGVFAGMQANAHSLGAMIVAIQLFTLFIFMQGSLKGKMIKVTAAAGLIVLFGGIHYLLDMVTGTGWIFQELKFY